MTAAHALEALKSVITESCSADLREYIADRCGDIQGWPGVGTLDCLGFLKRSRVVRMTSKHGEEQHRVD